MVSNRYARICCFVTKTTCFHRVKSVCRFCVCGWNLQTSTCFTWIGKTKNRHTFDVVWWLALYFGTWKWSTHQAYIQLTLRRCFTCFCCSFLALVMVLWSTSSCYSMNVCVLIQATLTDLQPATRKWHTIWRTCLTITFKTMRILRCNVMNTWNTLSRVRVLFPS